jgi:hypothetical protein
MRNQNVAVFSVTISGLHQRYRPRQDAYFEGMPNIRIDQKRSLTGNGYATNIPNGIVGNRRRRRQ